MPTIRKFAGVSLIAMLALAGCSAGGADAQEAATPAAEATSVEVKDNNGAQKINLPLTSVVATDNRTFETLNDWGIELTAGAVSLMHEDNPYTKDSAIIDLGSHNEPNLEAVVAADPQLIINGQRYAQYHDDFAELVPDAVVLELDPRDGEPFDEELKRQTTILGEVFGKQKEAKELTDAFDKSIARVTDAYKSGDTVMAVTTSGGEIGYIAPVVGRSLGPVFDIVKLTPALEIDKASDDHQGDDISVEAIAQANPDWILVMDRDAVFASEDPSIRPGSEIIEKSEALAKVSAVASGQVVYMPTDTYLNEGIQTYTEFFNTFADALEAAK